MSEQALQIPDLSDAALSASVQERIRTRTGVSGSLGRLETLAEQLALLQQTETPSFEAPQCLVFAADHGIAQRGVSSMPLDGTVQSVRNLLDGNAAVALFAREQQLKITVIDSGMRADLAPQPGLVSAKVPGAEYGSDDFSRGPAMAPAIRNVAIEHGMRIARNLPGNAVLMGEIAVAGTSSGALLMSLLTQTPLEQCIGRGLGLSSEAQARKVTVLRMALSRHHRATAPLDALSAVGGLEIAAMVGAILQSAQMRKLIVIDGFSSTAAAAIAQAIAPKVLQRCVFSHRSAENGHARWLERLGVQPVLDLQMRLGEGTGAVLAWPVIRSAAALIANSSASESEPITLS